MKLIFISILLYCVVSIVCQNVGYNTPENHPQLQFSECNKDGCRTQTKSVVLDANWRWTHNNGGSTNCYTGNQWDRNLCPDPQTCARNCAIDGADYAGTYGIVSNGNSINLKFVTRGPYSTNIGSRVYLLNSDNQYQLLHLKNREFTFDVDISNLPCGLNGALYLVEMDADGGSSKYPGNKGGAKYGTGYCDAQCPHDLKWINGEANVLDWKPSSSDPNSGTGRYGTCCTEMDIWESNKISSAYTPHVCKTKGQYRCSGNECGDDPSNRYGGLCDKDGCDFNSYRMGNRTFFGPGSSFTIDTTKPFTVITQFITADGTDSGVLQEVRRFYSQNGHVIANSHTAFNGIAPYNSVSDAFCNDQKKLFGDKNDFEAKGGLRGVGDALGRGMVLVMSLWDDHAAYMLWLDSNYPTNQPASKPGVARGSCSINSGRPSDVQNQFPNSNVIFSNLRFGTIGSTFN